MKPRVAFLVGNFPALSSTFVINQISGLIDRGWDVRVFALRNPGEERIHPDVMRYGLVEKTQYFDLPQKKIKRVIGALKLIGTHIRYHPGKVLKSLSPWFFPGETLRLNTLFYLVPFLGRHFDVLLCHFGPNGLLGAMLKGLGIPGRLVTVFHGYDLSSFLRSRSLRVYAPLFLCGDLFLPVSHYWENKLVNLGCPEDRIRVHHMGVDLQRFSPSGQSLLKSGKLELLSVGRMVPKKGHAHVLRALRDFKVHNSWRYTIVGDGPLRQGLETLAAELGLHDKVHFAGPLTETEVLAFYRRSHVFLQTSVTGPDGDREGIPMVLMEAMAMRLPVISTRHSGIPELVTHGRTGFLVDEDDTVELRRRLGELANNEALRSRMGEAGRKVVEHDFNLKIQNRLLDDRLRSLIGRPREE